MRVLYVDVDSLRPDHLGCYGYHRDTSPTIDHIAEEGRRFTNYYTSDAPCLPSRTALFSGRFGVHTGVVNHGGRNADPCREGPDRGFRYQPQYRSLLRVLQDEGLYTAMISSFPSRHDAWQIVEGVREYYDPGKNGAERADEVYPYAERWLREHATEDDWLLHVNFWDPHTAYDTPAEYGNPFANDPAPEWLTDERIADQYESYGPHGAREPHGMGSDWAGVPDLERTPDEIAGREDFKQWVDGYDTGVRYMDDHLDRLLKVLEKEGVYDDTLVVVSADHGENLGELNVYGDHQTADDKTCRVPLIIRGPDVEPGIDDGFHYQVDLSATIVDLVGTEVPAGWDGRSFAASVTGGTDVGREFLVLSQGAWACQRGIRWDDWLLLRTYHDGYKATLDDVMLFDLAEDPHETRNLADAEPETVNEGLAKLGRWLDARFSETAHGERGGNPAAQSFEDPLWQVIHEGGPFHVRGRLDPYVEHLRDTGRTHHADELSARHADER